MWLELYRLTGFGGLRHFLDRTVEFNRDTF